MRNDTERLAIKLVADLERHLRSEHRTKEIQSLQNFRKIALLRNPNYPVYVLDEYYDFISS